MADPFGQYSEDIASQFGDPLSLSLETPDEDFSIDLTTSKVSEDIANQFDPTQVSSLNKQSYSLSDLEQDEEFNKIADRFLASVSKKTLLGGDDDIFEYLRDSNYSLSSAITRNIELGKWSEQDKNDYRYLKDKFENADIKSMRHRLKAITDATSDIVFDPFTLTAVLTAPFTLGQSLVGRVVLGQASKKALKDLTTHQLATNAAKITAVEGALWEGSHNYFNQKLDSNLGLGSANIDVLDVIQSGAVGGAAGAIGGYGITRALPVIGRGLQETKKFVEKTFRFSNEQDIIKEGNRGRKTITKENVLDDVTFGRNPLGTLSEYLVEKPTTKFIKYAKGSETLQELLGKIRYDWDDAVLSFTTEAKTRTPKDVRKESYGLAQARRQYSYITNMRKALQTLDRQGFTAHLSTEDNNLLLHLLRNPNTTTYKGKPIKSYLVKAAKEIKSITNQTFLDGKRVGVFTDDQKVTNYFPRRFNHSQVAANRGELEELIIKYGHAEPKFEYAKKDYVKGVTATGKEEEILKNTAEPIDVEVFGESLAKEIKRLFDAGNLDEARQLKAEAIVDNMLEFKYTPFDFLNKSRNSPGGYGFMKSRVFQSIPDEKLAPFLENNVEKVLTDYFTHASQAIERARFFGKNYEDFYDRYLVKIRNELRASGMPKNEVKKLEEGITTLYKRVTGLEVPRETNVLGYRSFSEWGRLANQMAHLPLATLSSVTEPLILFSRVGFKDYGNVTKDIVTALAQGTKKTLDRSLQTTLRTVGKPFGYKQKGTQAFKDLDDETWSEVYKTGLALEQAVMDRIEGMYGEAFESKGAQVLQNAFFSSNLLTQWTGAVQLASFTTGKRLITENLEKLYKNSTGEITLSKSKAKLLRDQLWELGVDDKKGITWYKNSLKDNVLDYSKSTTGRNKAFYENYVSAGANRFTKEVILNPNVAEANKPLWFNSAAGKVLMQFVGYPTVFNNTVLKRFAKQLTTSQSPQTLATVLLMTTGGIIGNAIRSDGKSLEKTDAEIIRDSVMRWGGLGPLEYGLRYQRNAELGGGLFGAALKLPPGPLVQDIVDSALYRQGPNEIITNNLPGYSAYDFLMGEGTQAELKADARDLDAELYRTLGLRPPVLKPKQFQQTGEIDRSAQAKGGIVYNVSNVHPEPDEVKMRGINATYNEVAGDILTDEEDRRGFASGMLVNLGKNITKFAAKNLELESLLSYIRKDTMKMPPAYRSLEDDPITYLTEEEAKDFTNSTYTDMTKLVYRPMRKDPTDKHHFDDFYYNSLPGVMTNTSESRAMEELIPDNREKLVPGLIRIKNPFTLDSFEANNTLVRKLFTETFVSVEKDFLMSAKSGNYLGEIFSELNNIINKSKTTSLTNERNLMSVIVNLTLDRLPDVLTDNFKDITKKYLSANDPSLETYTFLKTLRNLVLNAPKTTNVKFARDNRLSSKNKIKQVAKSTNYIEEIDILENTQIAKFNPQNIFKEFLNDMSDFHEVYTNVSKNFFNKQKELGVAPEDLFIEDLNFESVAHLYQNKKVAKLLQDLGYDSYSTETGHYLLDPSQFKAFDPQLLKPQIRQTDQGLASDLPVLTFPDSMAPPILPVYSETYNIINKTDFPKDMTYEEAIKRINKLPGIKELEKEDMKDILKELQIQEPNRLLDKDNLLSMTEVLFKGYSDLKTTTRKTPEYYSFQYNKYHDLSDYGINFNDMYPTEEAKKQWLPLMHIVKGGKQIKSLIDIQGESGLAETISSRMQTHTGEDDVISFAIRSPRRDTEGNWSFMIDQLQTDLGPLLKKSMFSNSAYKFAVLSVLKEAAANKKIKQVSLIDPITVNEIDGINLQYSKANRLYSTPKLLEVFPVSKESLDIGTNVKEGLGYKAFKSAVQDLGEDPNKVLTYKTYPEFTLVQEVPVITRGLRPSSSDGFKNITKEQVLQFLDLRKRNAKGELNEEEQRLFSNLTTAISQGNEGSIQNKYNLASIFKYKFPESMFDFNPIVRSDLNDPSFLSKLEQLSEGNLKFKPIPMLTIELTDEIREKLLSTRPARLSKKEGGKI